MPLSKADTRAKLVDPALHAYGWTEDLLSHEELTRVVEIVDGKPGNYDPKAVNLNAKADEEPRKPGELLELIEAKGKEVQEALAKVRAQ